MANRLFQQFFFSLNHAPTYLEANCVIDSGQASKTRSLKGSGVKAISWVATGTYKVQLENHYFRYLGGVSGFVSPTTGGTIAATAISPGTMYIIASVGTTTNWQTAGVPVGVTPAVGMAFLCASASTGNGLAIAVGVSASSNIEVVGDPNTTVTQTADPHFFIQTLAPVQGVSATTLAPADPANGSVLGLTIFLRNSSVPGKGE